MRHLFVLIVSAFPALAWACSVPPRTLSDSNEELVRSTRVVVLAKAVSTGGVGPGGFSTFQFEPVRALKGDPPKAFELRGYDSERVKGPADFASHTDPAFWAYDSGNTIQPGDCIAHGVFQVGETYLIFLREASHYRAYENVRSDGDLWLRVVQLLIDSEKAHP